MNYKTFIKNQSKKNLFQERRPIVLKIVLLIGNKYDQFSSTSVSEAMLCFMGFKSKSYSRYLF